MTYGKVRLNDSIRPKADRPFLAFRSFSLHLSILFHLRALPLVSPKMNFWFGYACLWAICIYLFGREFPCPSSFSEALAYLPVPTFSSTLVHLSYIFVLILLGIVIPTKPVPGTLLPDKKSRLEYKCNGLIILVVVVLTLGALAKLEIVDPTWIARNIGPLFASANLFSLTLSAYLFVQGRYLKRGKNWFKQVPMWEDFVMGAELNPHILGLDVKFFSYRPSMIGWMLVNYSYMALQYKDHGFISSRMILYQVLTSCYIIDYFYNEIKMISTWDIIAEHFGLMLIWGDFVFINFFFAIQNLYLIHDPSPLHVWELLLTLTFAIVGVALFRGANSQKHHFKEFPEDKIWGKSPQLVGGKLLVSGFWGIARHINYLGDLMLALSFCLPCGFKYAGAYFYFVYLLLLLLHRNKRDEERMAQKYKDVWREYCKRVPWAILPYVY